MNPVNSTLQSSSTDAQSAPKLTSCQRFAFQVEPTPIIAHHQIQEMPIRRRGLVPQRSVKDTRASIHRLSSAPISGDAITGNMTSQLCGPSSWRNQLSFIICSVGVIIYCVLLSSNEYTIWAYPILIAASACWLLSEETPRSITVSSRPSQISLRLQQVFSQCKCRTVTRILINDMNHGLALLKVLIITIPCTIFVVKKIATHLATKTGTKLHEEIANDFGKLAVAAMSYFLIPVSNHSKLLEAAGIGSIHAVRLHIWAGCIAIFGGLVHGLYYVWIWIFLKEETLEKIFPLLSGDCWVRGYGSSCHTRFVNLSGILCGISFILLGLTSIWWVRRNFYRLFYFAHATFSIILLLGLTMHYNKMILYLAPSLLYYMASNVPVCLEAMKKWYHGGNAISKVIHIPASGGCVEVSLQIPTLHDAPTGKYVRLSVPEISFKSHPFTVFSHPDHPGDGKVIFRTFGAFTSQLSHKLANRCDRPERQFPKVLVNGLHAGTNQLEQALQHDNIIIVAGGVGIVAYISLLASLLSQLHSTTSRGDVELGDARTKRSDLKKHKFVDVHWACRDEGLIKHILNAYMTPLQRRAESDISPLEITFTVHHTSRDQMQEEQLCNASLSESIFVESVAPPVPPAFRGHKKLLHNLVPTFTFAAIAWGGLWIINYCYDNVQSKHVMETRPVAVGALILWSLAASMVSIFAVSMSSTVRSKFLYTKVGTTMMEIECPEIVSGCSDEEFAAPSAKVTLPKDSTKAVEETESVNETVCIHHSKGRPDFALIIQGALNERVNNGSSNDIGIFTCGPSSLVNSLRAHCRGVGSSRGNLCATMFATSRAGVAAVVYEEKYEL